MCKKAYLFIMFIVFFCNLLRSQSFDENFIKKEGWRIGFNFKLSCSNPEDFYVIEGIPRYNIGYELIFDKKKKDRKWYYSYGIFYDTSSFGIETYDIRNAVDNDGNIIEKNISKFETDATYYYLGAIFRYSYRIFYEKELGTIYANVGLLPRYILLYESRYKLRGKEEQSSVSSLETNYLISNLATEFGITYDKKLRNKLSMIFNFAYSYDLNFELPRFHKFYVNAGLKYEL